MKKIWKIYRTDFKRIFTNKVALVTVLVLMIIPSLYAWINIKACWDPYSNTGNLPVAVVNNDRGTAIQGKEINVGDQVIDSLKENKSINWQFVDQWQGNYGVNEGKYYAMIEIPSDFSNSLTTLVTLNPKKPDIIYRCNEKANAIASKITAVAKDKLTKEITTNFVETVNKKAIEFTNTLGGELQTNKAEILQVNDTLKYSQDTLQSIIHLVDNASKDANSLQNYLYKVQNTLPVVNDEINALQGATENSKEVVRATQKTLNLLSNNMKNNLMEMQIVNSKIQSLITELKHLNNGESADKVAAIEKNLNKMSNLNKSNLDYLNLISHLDNNPGIQNMIDETKANEATIDDAINKAKNINGNININDMLDNLSKLSNDMSSNLITLGNSFYNTTIKVVNNKSSAMINNLDIINSTIEGTRFIIPQLNALSNFGIAASGISQKKADETSDKLNSFQNDLYKLQDKTKGLDEGAINNLVKMMNKNPDDMSNFIASPIQVTEEEVYKGGVFGVGITPFYTVLAIWVGALLATSILSTEFRETRRVKGVNLIEEHFGKMGIFLTVSIIQGLIVSGGDILILGIEPESIPLFFFMTVLTSIMFTFITFTLASVLSNVGKAIAVIIMVLQIAGAGGLYPVQTNPEFFQIINPYLPFTYAILGFREAIGGIEIHNTLKYIAYLSSIGIGFFLLVLLKKPLHKLIHWFDKTFKKAGI